MNNQTTPAKVILARLAAAAIVAAAGPLPSFAQVSASGSTPPSNSTQIPEQQEPVTLSEFTVNETSDRGYSATQAIGATRTAVAIKDLSQTVLVLTQELLNDMAPTEQYDALKYLSGISVTSNSGDNYTFRGNVLEDNYTGGLPDVQYQSQAGAEPFLNSRLEVFKGPSALVYGSTSPGGVLNQVRKEADPSHRVGGTVGIMLGNHAQKRVEFDYEGKITKNFNYRLVGVWRDEDLIQGVATRFAFTRRYNILPTFAWRINERAQLKFGFEGMDEKTFKHWADATALAPFGRNGPTTYSTGLLPRNFTFSDSSAYNSNQKSGAFSSLEMQLSDMWSMRLLSSVYKWEHETNDWVPNGIAADNRTMPRRHRLTTDDRFRSAVALDTVFKFKTGPFEHHIVALGQYNYFRYESGTIQDANLFPIDIFEPNYYQSASGGTLVNPYAGFAVNPDVISTFVAPSITVLNTNRGSQQSVSGQDQIKFAGGRLQIVGGARYDSVVRQNANRRTGSDGTVNRSHVWTSKIGGIWSITPDLNVYYHYGETFQPIFSSQPDGTPLKSTYGVISEVGAKSSLLDGRLSGTLAVFRLKKTNIIGNDPDPARASEGWRVQSAFNEVEGVELDLVFSLGAGWETMVSGSVVSIEQPDALVPRGVPDRTAALWTRYSFRSGALARLSVGGGISWTGPTPLETGNQYFGNDTATIDAFAKYSWKRYSFQLNVSNLTDEWYLNRGVSRAILLQAPERLIKLTIRYRL